MIHPGFISREPNVEIFLKNIRTKIEKDFKKPSRVHPGPEGKQPGFEMENKHGLCVCVCVCVCDSQTENNELFSRKRRFFWFIFTPGSELLVQNTQF